MSRFKPLLAATIETAQDFESLTYPLYGSPKLDGIRVLLHPEHGPITRSMKPVANKWIREYLSDPRLAYLDGEVVVGDPTAPNVFNITQSAVMSHGGTPDFTYIVFDCFAMSNLACPFTTRLADAKNIVDNWNELAADAGTISRVQFLEHEKLDNAAEIDAFEQAYLEQGYEGMMLRKPSGKYKHNRSTLKEQILMKLKRFEDAEARITGWEPLYRNQNEAFTDERGYQKRSAHQAGKVADDTLVGKLHLRGVGGRWDGVGFACGSGLDDDERRKLRKMAEDGTLLGRLVTYKYQPHGSKDAPRAPIYKGLRPELE
jgi:DNA ligase-1